MGIAPSSRTTTELHLPSDTLRLCFPGDRCWCNGRHLNRNSPKYVYVERGGDGDGDADGGRERYRDPVEVMGEFLMGGGGGGGGGGGLPWKSPGEWTVRDYERLGEVLGEWQVRERGRRRGGDPSNGYGHGGGGGNNIYGPNPWDGGGGGGGGGSGRRRRTHHHPSWNEFERMQETVEEKFRRMAEEYQRHLAERDSLLFGSATEHRREQYRNHMLKTLQEILPQLSQMMAAQQMGGAGMNNLGMGMGMQSGGMPGMGAMGGGPGMGSMGGGPGMGGMQAGGMGMQGGGMNVNPMMNPMAAAAMGGGAGMGQMNTPMMPGGGGGMNDFGGMGGVGGGYPRRGRGRRERPFREDFEEEFGGAGGGGRRAGRPFRRGRRGGWEDDDEDLLGGNYGGDDFSPKRPQGGPRRPRQPDGGDLDDMGGGIAHDERGYGHRVDDPLGAAAHSIPSPHAHFSEYTHSPGMGYTETHQPERGDIHPMVPPLRRPTPLGHPHIWPPENSEIRPTSDIGTRQWPSGSARQTYGADIPPMFTSGPEEEEVPSSLRPGAATTTTRREAGFQPEARLSRPRDEEADRREPEAGAAPTKRDLQ